MLLLFVNCEQCIFDIITGFRLFYNLLFAFTIVAQMHQHPRIETGAADRISCFSITLSSYKIKQMIT